VRAAQGKSNEQRNVVAQVQQQIQLLAAESRNIDEQARQFAFAARPTGHRVAAALPRPTPCAWASSSSQ
jgi:chromosome segregation protein